jgi:small subunit ribosomal protein S10
MTPTKTAKKATKTKKAVAVEKPPVEAEGGPRIRVKISAYDHKIIDAATKTIIDTAERNSATIVGPVPLPTSKTKFSVNRSSFVHKTAQEQYEIRVHKRLIDILNPTPKAIDALMNLNLPSGVDVEIKMS